MRGKAVVQEDKDAWVRDQDGAAGHGAGDFVFVLNAGQALATHVSCGDVVYSNTRLDSDLIDCPGIGIAIGVDNIVLDLNGHTIDGVEGELQSGIANSHDGVAVKDGTVKEFRTGVSLGAGNHNVVHTVKTSSNLVGIALGGRENQG